MVLLVGWLSVLSALLLVASSVIGGFITHFFGWRENFWFLVVFTILALVAAFIKIPETHENKKLINVKSFIRLIIEMSSSTKFILVLMPVISFYALQGAFLSSSPYIVMNKYGFSPIEFGLSNIFIVVGIMIGRQLTMYLLDKKDELFIFKTGGILSLLLVGLFVFMFFGFICGVWKFLIISGLFALVLGLISPVLMKSSITAFSLNSGVAAAFQGTLLLGASAIGSAFCSLLIKFMHMSVFKSFVFLSILFLLLSSITLFYLSNIVAE
jgi:predicted MFS family arabinose efflux permease